MDAAKRLKRSHCEALPSEGRCYSPRMSMPRTVPALHRVCVAFGFLGLVLVACVGGRTDLGQVIIVDAIDASPDHRIVDASRDRAESSTDPDAFVSCGFDGDPSPAATHSYGACGEGVNTDHATTDNCGGAGAAFEYVPLMDVVVSRLEVHTTNGFVGLLDSNCDRPGKLLFLGQLDGPPDVPMWRGADVFPVITVKANHRYFFYQRPSANLGTMCSVASSGVEVREYTSPGPSGPWDGPFSGLAWTGRAIGTCP